MTSPSERAEWYAAGFKLQANLNALVTQPANPQALADLSRGAVVSAAQLRWVREYCERRYTDAAANLDRHHAEPLCACCQCRESRAIAVTCREVLSRLPAPSPAVSIERRADSAGEVTGMAGTRVTAVRGDDDEAAFGGGEDDREL